MTFTDETTGRFRSPTEAEARALFESRVPDLPADECWPWQGALTSRGYGQFHVSGQPFTARLAHRWAFYFAHDRAPQHEVGHTCDNPPCVNPAHLEDVTRLKNEQDKTYRGRRPTGVRNLPCPKCGGSQDGRSSRGDGRVFAYCIPCRKKYLREYQRKVTS